MNPFDLDLLESHVSTVELLTRIPIEEVFQLEYGGEAHGVSSQRFDKLGVTPIDVLQSVTLVLDPCPQEAQIGELVHFAGQEFWAD